LANYLLVVKYRKTGG